jgi:hypothetical protein
MRVCGASATRLNNAFSKKLDNHIHALALYFAFHNFCRIYKSLKITPAIAAGVTDWPGRWRTSWRKLMQWHQLRLSAIPTKKRNAENSN